MSNKNKGKYKKKDPEDLNSLESNPKLIPFKEDLKWVSAILLAILVVTGATIFITDKYGDPPTNSFTPEEIVQDAGDFEELKNASSQLSKELAELEKTVDKESEDLNKALSEVDSLNAKMEVLKKDENLTDKHYGMSLAQFNKNVEDQKALEGSLIKKDVCPKGKLTLSLPDGTFVGCLN